ncbi:hypothetical protein ACHAPJ_011431 [Fusarium lateritium]
MPVTFHLVRHAQGFHNLSREHEKIQDPDLTDLGKQQCAALKASFPYNNNLTHFVASPLKRALSTCLLGFAPPAEIPIVALAELKEVGDAPCDTGSHIELLKRDFPHLLDLSHVPEAWTTVHDWVSWEVKLGQLKERAVGARAALQQLARSLEENEHVVVVTHGAFLHFLTEDYYGVKPKNATGWTNTEFRSYQFLGADNGDAALVETQESWTKRNGDIPRPSRQEQEALGEFYYEQLGPFLVPGSWLVKTE